MAMYQTCYSRLPDKMDTECRQRCTLLCFMLKYNPVCLHMKWIIFLAQILWWYATHTTLHRQSPKKKKYIKMFKNPSSLKGTDNRKNCTWNAFYSLVKVDCQKVMQQGIYCSRYIRLWKILVKDKEITKNHIKAASRSPITGNTVVIQDVDQLPSNKTAVCKCLLHVCPEIFKKLHHSDQLI